MQLLIPNSLNQAEEYKNAGAGRLAWLGRWLYEPKVAGSSPARPTTFRNPSIFVYYYCETHRKQNDRKNWYKTVASQMKKEKRYF
jgi:hypothetical protein